MSNISTQFKKGHKHSQETIDKIRLSKKGNSPAWNKGIKMPNMIGNTYGFKKGQTPYNKGKKGLVVGWTKGIKIDRNLYPNFGHHIPHSPETIQKMKEQKLRDTPRGKNSYHWIEDRTKVKLGDRFLNDPLQKQWRRAVKDRDNWKCRIADNNCDGRLEAHHILPWKDFSELRYEVNNGITLCHFHHPRKLIDVKKLSPYLQQLVAEM